jgi:hypothetical protein
MITSFLPAWLETRICLRLRQHGLNPVYLVQCLSLLYPLLLCVAYSCAVVDEKRSHHWCDTKTKKPKKTEKPNIFCKKLQNMLPIKLFQVVFCLFRFNRNIETLCFGIEAKQLKQTFCFG